jgi:hypothetical protein
MRKTMLSLIALALLAGFSGFAMADGKSGFCDYSSKKHQAKVETEKTQPVASKTDKADDNVAMAVIEKTQPARDARK